jgi:hypothetical protein
LVGQDECDLFAGTGKGEQVFQRLVRRRVRQDAIVTSASGAQLVHQHSKAGRVVVHDQDCGLRVASG